MASYDYMLIRCIVITVIITWAIASLNGHFATVYVKHSTFRPMSTDYHLEQKYEHTSRGDNLIDD